MQKISKNQFPFILLAIILVLLIIGGFFDYQISKGIMNQGSLFGTAFQNYGMFPKTLVLFLAGQVVAARGYKAEKKEIGALILILAGLGFALFSAFQCVDGWLYYTYSSLNNVKEGLLLGVANNDGGHPISFPYSLKVGIGLVLWLIGSGLSFKWLSGKSKEQMNYLSVVALAGVAVVFTSDTVVDTMKNLWGRFRPYEIFGSVEGAHYTPWWQINGVNGHKSFPSGHSQIGWLALYLPFFVDRKNLKLQSLLVKITAIFGLLMASSRVIIGAHFLSDVTVGSTITILIIFIASRLMNAKFVEEK
ncbi:MAG: phosphatase PAP2 family protein [Lactobacillales bacterium]|jgi:membrane-associated phospholipid phosphatase|nr:phosphatase PAP2 family protein [Lactobacillales bacterium]